MEFKICPKCNTLNELNMRYCKSCNYSLKNVEIQDENDNKKGITNCPFCGEPINSEDKRCKWCKSYISKAKSIDNEENIIFMSSGNEISDNIPRSLLYLVTLLIPIFGLFIGGIFVASETIEKQILGKDLIIMGLILSIIYIIITILLL